MPLPKSGDRATAVRDHEVRSEETGVRLEDVRIYAGEVVSALALSSASGVAVAHTYFNNPATTGALSVLGVTAVILFGLAVFAADDALCKLTERHTCRHCRRETDRWRSETDDERPALPEGHSLPSQGSVERAEVDS
jgi:hypothetical protein